MEQRIAYKGTRTVFKESFGGLETNPQRAQHSFIMGFLWIFQRPLARIPSRSTVFAFDKAHLPVQASRDHRVYQNDEPGPNVEKKIR